ncbi:MAG: dephospho-CoA kinase, partial [Desulfobacterales bacterium]|nr:dephospho-CoA kinase [Desulfobacterales bacterium]
TGGAASGKTTVCGLFRAKGVAVCIADDLARQAVAPGSDGFQGVVNHFGPKAVTSEGELDRSWLRDRLVSYPEDRKVLETIVQPQVVQLMKAFLIKESLAGASMAVCEVPLLFELNLCQLFDVTVHVGVKRSVQLERLMVRDGVSLASAEKLLALQLSDDEKRGRAHWVIENSGGLKELECCFHEVFEKIMKK